MTMDDSVIVKVAGDKGKGVFARRAFHPGDCILRFQGRIVHHDALAALTPWEREHLSELTAAHERSRPRLRLRWRMASLAQLDVLVREVVQPLLDLIEEVRAGSALVLVAQFEDHLAEPPDRPYRMVGIIFADRMRVPWCEPGFIIAWQSSRLSLQQ